MNSGYEKIRTDRQLPAVIAYLDQSVADQVQELGRPAYIPPHWHRSIEMSLVMKGSVELWVNKERKILRPGDFIFVNSGCVHQLREGDEKDTAVMMVILSYEFLKKVYPDIDRVWFQPDPEAEGWDRIREIYGEFRKYSQSPQPLDYIRMNGYLYEIVYFLLANCVAADPEAGKRVRKVNRTQKEILNFIEEHYREELTLKRMAERFGMSEEHFSRKFHQYFGIAFKTYLDRYRIYQAFADLIGSEKSMQQIAMEQGFPNVKSFLSHFKREYGMTPYQYRKNYKMSKKDNF